MLIAGIPRVLMVVVHAVSVREVRVNVTSAVALNDVPELVRGRGKAGIEDDQEKFSFRAPYRAGRAGRAA